MTTNTNHVSPAGQQHIAQLYRRIAQYQRSIRWLLANEPDNHKQLSYWYEKTELAENTIRMIERGAYDEMTGEVC